MHVAAVSTKFVTKVFVCNFCACSLELFTLKKYNLGERLLTCKGYETGRGVWQEFRVRLVPW